MSIAPRTFENGIKKPIPLAAVPAIDHSTVPISGATEDDERLVGTANDAAIAPQKLAQCRLLENPRRSPLKRINSIPIALAYCASLASWPANKCSSFRLRRLELKNKAHT